MGFLLVLALALASFATPHSAEAFASAQIVKDLTPGSGGSYPNFSSAGDHRVTVAIGSTVYFIAAESSPVYSLWKTDGTSGGTVAIPLPGPNTVVGPDRLTVSGGKLYFTAYDQTAGEYVLCVYDPAGAGTVHYMTDITTAAISSFGLLTDVNGVLYFGSYSDKPAPLNGTGVFSWDGTNVARHSLGGGGQRDSVDDIIDMGSGNLIVVARHDIDQDSSTDKGHELYYGNGTSISLIADLNPGAANGIYGYAKRMGSNAFFPGLDATHLTNTILYKTNGTTMTVVKDFGAIGGGVAGYFTTDGTTLYFVANDSAHASELWKSDGTTVGTTMLTDRVPTEDPMNFGVVNGKDFFAADDIGPDSAAHHYLWVTNGTTTTRLKQLDNMSNGDNLHPVAFGTNFLFTAGGIGGNEPYISDGTAPGTRRLFDVNPGSNSSNPLNYVSSSTNSFFFADDGSHGYELWTTNAVTAYPLDVTMNGTGYVSSVPAGIACGSPNYTECSETYPTGTVVRLTTLANYLSHAFVSWSGACTGTSLTCDVTMSQARSVTANYDDGTTGPSTFTLTTSKIGTGTGTVTSNPAGIDCGSDCTEDYSAATPVTLTAAADTGSVFAGWSGACTNATGVCDVTISAARSVTATFNTAPTLSINDVSAKEGRRRHTKTFTFTVTISGTVSATATVHWETLDGVGRTAAKAPADYTAGSDVLSFSPGGPTTMPIEVTVKGDARKERNEKFSVHLSSPTNATISDADGTGTIKNDDH